MLALGAAFAVSSADLQLQLDGTPIPATRLFPPPEGGSEWSDTVLMARGQIDGPWEIALKPSGPATLHPPFASTEQQGILRIRGNGPARFGVEMPTQRLLVFLDPPEPPPPANAKQLTASAHDATAALQALLDTAPPGGTVLVPPGRFTIGTIFLRPGVRLHLARGACLVASLDPGRYPELPNFGGMKYALLVAREAHGASLTGQGVIDAQGHRLRRMLTTGRHPGTRLLAAIDTRGLSLEGITLLDAFAWTGHFQNCEDLTVRNVAAVTEINTPGWNGKGAHHTWNNADGLNPDGCRNLLFEDLFLHTGDDAVAVKNMDAKNRVEQVTVRGAVIWTPVAALKVGTESRGESMRDLTFESIHVARAGRVLALDIFDTATASNIRFRNITIDRCDQSLLFRAGKRTAAQTSVGRIQGVSLEGIRFLRDTFPPGQFETPHTAEPLGLISVSGWSAGDHSAPTPAAGGLRGLDRAPDLRWEAPEAQRSTRPTPEE